MNPARTGQVALNKNKKRAFKLTFILNAVCD